MTRIYLFCLCALAVFFVTETSVSKSRLISYEKSRYKRSVDSLNYRLPNKTIPEQYNIKLSTGGSTFQGEVTIQILIIEDTSRIVLNARQFKISEVKLTNLATGDTEELSYQYDPEKEFLILERKDDVIYDAKTQWNLTIIYSGEFSIDNKGFHLPQYKSENGIYYSLVLTTFEKTNARQVFPCYDELAKRANFTLTLVHNPAYSAISNMPVNEALSSPGTTVFLTTAKIPSYTVAFVVSELEYIEGTWNGIRHRVYSRPDVKRECKFALMSSMLITEYFSDYFGVEFMLPKMDHVAAPDSTFEAIENWGLAIYPENNLLFDKNSLKLNDQTDVARTIAHELSQQWFGSFVTFEWWSLMWLKEGLATFFSYKALDKVYTEWNVWQQFYTDIYTNNLQNNLDTHQKVAAVWLMWSEALTDEVFQKGYYNFLSQNQYSSVAEAQLFTALQTAADERKTQFPASVSEMMTTWFQQDDYPLLTITRNYDDGTFTIKQQAYTNEETLKSNKTWYIPINYATASQPNFDILQATDYLANIDEMKINSKIAKKHWLILNKQSKGFYRIKYDDENYRLITESLLRRPSRIHVLNRAQILADAFQLSSTNHIQHATLLNIFQYLKQEDQYAPWFIASSIVEQYVHYLNAHENYNDLKSFVANQVGPVYKKFGIDNLPGEHHLVKYTRKILINTSCLVGVKECLKETNNKLKTMISKNLPLESNLETTIYFNGLRDSDDEVFSYVYQKFINSTNIQTRLQLISVLCCSQKESQINKLVNEADKLTRMEHFNLFSKVYSNGETGLLICIKFIEENLNVYESFRDGFFSLHSDIRGIAFNVVSKKAEDKLKDLVLKLRNEEQITASFEAEINNVMAFNFNWLKNQGEPIMSWILQNSKK